MSVTAAVKAAESYTQLPTQGRLNILISNKCLLVLISFLLNVICTLTRQLQAGHEPTRCRGKRRERGGFGGFGGFGVFVRLRSGGWFAAARRLRCLWITMRLSLACIAALAAGAGLSAFDGCVLELRVSLAARW